jgi:Domain of unknown function (DUF1848).
VIVSASYRTDIPTFYGEWFLRRLAAGYCLVRNPYNGEFSRVSLERPGCEGFVFWTKNAATFLPALEEVAGRGFPFVVQYTVNGYPRALEWSVTNAQRSVGLMQEIAARYSPLALVWRYDPVLFSTLTPATFHEENFGRLAEKLRGATDEVVISFAQIYRKTRANLDAAGRIAGFAWDAPGFETKSALAAKLSRLAADCGMRLSICAQREFLQPGVEDAACIDLERLSRLAGYRIRAPRRAHRPACGCWASRDIGAYDTCPHGCVYCYAVQTRARARRVFRQHNPEAESL